MWKIPLCTCAFLNTIVLTVTGCGGLNGATTAIPRSVPGATDLAARSCSSQVLLYITGRQQSWIYTGSRLCATVPIPGEGPCSNRAGNVYIPTSTGSKGEILEYAHGGTTPIETLTGLNDPQDCAIDPKTGNLAVTERERVVKIFLRARGKPTTYYVVPGGSLRNCAYDGSGNLFVDGEAMHSSFVAELPKGGSVFTVWYLNGTPPLFPGGVQFYDRHVVIGNARSCYLGTLGSRRKFDRCGGLRQFWISSNRLIAANRAAGTVSYWNYLEGGKPTLILGNLPGAYGVTVSIASRQ